MSGADARVVFAAAVGEAALARARREPDGAVRTARRPAGLAECRR